MNILHITPYYAPAWAYGGVVSAVTGLATAQAARGHAVRALTTDALDFEARNPTEREICDGVEVIRCRNRSQRLRARLNLSSPRGFRSALRELAAWADVIHVHELRTVENLLLSTVRTRAPLVLSPHGTLPYGTGRSLFKRGWDVLLGRWLGGRVAAVAALTVHEAEEARQLWRMLRLREPAVSLLPNGVDRALLADLDAETAGELGGRFRARWKLGAGPLVLFLGRLHERKGLQYLIPAFVKADVPYSRLIIAGPDAGVGEMAQELVRVFRFTKRVRFTGLLTGRDKIGALKAADVFALPAEGEGLSMAALEAMAARLPVILTPGCNLPEAASRGAGLVVEREVAPLAAALRDLMRSAEDRHRMGDAGRAWVEESFTWPVIAARAEAVYAGLITRRAN